MCDCSVVQEERGSGTKRDKWDDLEGGDSTATNLHPTVGQSALGWALYAVMPILVHFPLFLPLSFIYFFFLKNFCKSSEAGRALQTAWTEAVEATLTFEVASKCGRHVSYADDPG